MISDNTQTSNIGSPYGSGDELGQVWMKRIRAANEYYTKWEQRMKCSKLESYYMGEQWEPSGTNYEPYVTNLIFSSIEIKKPTLLFENPVFHVKPRPQGEAYDLEAAVHRAQLREDLLNTIVSDPKIKFADRIELAILDAHFRFSVIEVGYDADWINNPNADMPVLRSDNEPFTDDEGNVLKQPKKLPKNERIYIKRIPGKNFRVGGIQSVECLNDCNWCGYWEWVRIEDLKANNNLENVDKISWAGGRSADYVDEAYGPQINDLIQTGDLGKIWHIWDNRAKKKYIFFEYQSLTIFKAKFKRLPLFDLRYHKLTEGWYPLPPVRNWKSPQDEYNEAREQQKNHRKRFNRKYVYKRSAFMDDDQDKLLNGGDGTFVGTDSPEPVSNLVAPVANADVGAATMQSLQISKEDFNLISGTSTEEQAVPDRGTATQANITNQKSQIRDSFARQQVASFLADVGREILQIAEDEFTLPMWIKEAVSPGQFLDNVQLETQVWKQITSEDIQGDFDFDVSITLDSISPVENDNERNRFMLFVAGIMQYPELSADPLLVREFAYKCGYRNEKVIQRMQQAAQLQLAQKLQAGQQQNPQVPQAPNGAPQMAQNAVAAAQPPIMEQIRNHVLNQGQRLQ